jgi:hypothetical protein
MESKGISVKELNESSMLDLTTNNNSTNNTSDGLYSKVITRSQSSGFDGLSSHRSYSSRNNLDSRQRTNRYSSPSPTPSSLSPRSRKNEDSPTFENEGNIFFSDFYYRFLFN